MDCSKKIKTRLKVCYLFSEFHNYEQYVSEMYNCIVYVIVITQFQITKTKNVKIQALLFYCLHLSRGSSTKKYIFMILKWVQHNWAYFSFFNVRLGVTVKTSITHQFLPGLISLAEGHPWCWQEIYHQYKDGLWEHRHSITPHLLNKSVKQRYN
jgi:hypothetical protein